MKKSTLVAFIVFCFQNIYSQQVERYSINNGGGFSALNDIQFSSSIGQPVIGYSISQDVLLSQGFQQARIVQLPEGVNSHKLLSFKLFPNPTSSYVSIRFEFITKGSVTMQVFDAAGKLVRNFDIEYYIGPATHTIQLYGLSSGAYVVVLKYKTQIIASEKLIIY